MEKENNKIISVAFVVAGAIAYLVINVLIETAAATWGFAQRLYSQDWFAHGAPAAAFVIVFSLLQFNPKIWAWADEVVSEVRKVVWPSKKDTTAMTVVCCVMLVIAGIILGLMDFVSRHVVNLIVN